MKELYRMCVMAMMFASLDMAAMELLPEELIIIAMTFCEPKQISSFSLVNKHWYKLSSSDILWKALYIRRTFDDQKIDEDKSYKENYKVASKPTEIHHLTCSGSRVNTLAKLRKNRYKFILHEHRTNIDCLMAYRIENRLDNIKKLFNDSSSKIFLSDYSFYSSITADSKLSIPKLFAEVMEEARKKDVLMVLSLPHIAIQQYTSKTDIGDLHEIYPNVIWVSPLGRSGELAHYASFGDLVDVVADGFITGVDQEGGMIAANIVAELAAFMWWQRPNLKAFEIRQILKETADREKYQEKMPNGGVLNAEAALARLKRPLSHENPRDMVKKNGNNPF